jgi:hypothetical protein
VAIVDIGHVGINTPSGRFTLVPSLAAIASLDDPVDMYSDLVSLDTPHEWRMVVAHDVIKACADRQGIDEYLGLRPISKPRIRAGVKTTKYRPVYIDDIHACAIAESLLFHGMIGKVEIKAKPKDSDVTSTFSPQQWAMAAMSHLEISEGEAWSMTMTSILNAFKTKYPPSEKQKALDNYDEEKALDDAFYESIYGGIKP